MAVGVPQLGAPQCTIGSAPMLPRDAGSPIPAWPTRSMPHRAGLRAAWQLRWRRSMAFAHCGDSQRHIQLRTGAVDSGRESLRYGSCPSLVGGG